MYLFQAICLLCVYLHQAGKFYFLSECTRTASCKFWIGQVLLLAYFEPDKLCFWQILVRKSTASGKFWTEQVLLLVNFETDKHCRLQIVDRTITNSGKFWTGHITKTCLYNFDPLKPYFYIVKLGFTKLYIIFHISAQKHNFGYSLEPPRWGGSNECHNLCF